jgi:hypothetical protein
MFSHYTGSAGRMRPVSGMTNEQIPMSNEGRKANDQEMADLKTMRYF